MPQSKQIIPDQCIMLVRSRQACFVSKTQNRVTGMKFLFDLFPIILFFAAYKAYDIYTATLVAIIASVVQVALYWLRHHRFESMHIVTLVIVLSMGGATLLLHDERFIKWKPTIINWLFAGVFLVSQFVGSKPVIARMMGSSISLPPGIWARLNIMWILFFVFLGISNLYVIYHFDTDTWVNFKLFGMMGLTLLFVIGQGFYLARYLGTTSEDGANSS